MKDEAVKLPEPFDWCYEWDGPYGTRKFSTAPHNGRKPDRTVPIFTADQVRAAVLEAVAQEMEVLSLIEQHRMHLTSWPNGGWSADIPGEPGDPDKNPDPKPGEPGHVKATAFGATLAEAVRSCVAAIRNS